jgi:hypothetical protein
MTGARRVFPSPSPNPSFLKRWRPEAVPDAFAGWMLGIPFDKTSLIVRRRGQSLIDTLRSARSTPIPAIALTVEQLNRPAIADYLKSLEATTDGEFINQVIVEMPADLPQIDAALTAVLNTTLARLSVKQRAFLWALPPADDQNKPQIIAPTTLDAILQTFA